MNCPGCGGWAKDIVSEDTELRNYEEEQEDLSKKTSIRKVLSVCKEVLKICISGK